MPAKLVTARAFDMNRSIPTIVSVRVLVVGDDEVAAAAHATYVGRMSGFELAGVARSAGEAVRLLGRDAAIDLILLDMHLPDGHWLGLLQRLRA